MSTAPFFKSMIQQERALFGNVLAAVPDDGLGYRADPKARTARDLMEHLIGHNLDLIELLDDGVIHHRNQVAFEDVASGVAHFDESFGGILERLDRTPEDRWSAQAKFFAGDHLVMEAPCRNLAWMFFLDAIHHRGQLSTYLRPMGSRVPAIYGPSADDQGHSS